MSVPIYFHLLIVSDPIYSDPIYSEFRDAVDRFLERETDAISHYMDELDAPFRNEPPPAKSA